MLIKSSSYRGCWIVVEYERQNAMGRSWMSTGSTLDYVVLHGFLEGLVSVELSTQVP